MIFGAVKKPESPGSSIALVKRSSPLSIVCQAQEWLDEINGFTRTGGWHIRTIPDLTCHNRKYCLYCLTPQFVLCSLIKFTCQMCRNTLFSDQVFLKSDLKGSPKDRCRKNNIWGGNSYNACNLTPKDNI